MIYSERLLKIIKFPHISEKTSIILEKNNIVVLRVEKCSTKIDIKNAIRMLYSVQVSKINILIVYGKKKGSKKNIGYRSNWKKAYVILKPGSKLDFINKIG